MRGGSTVLKNVRTLSRTLQIVRVPSLAGQVYEQITKAIITLDLPPGERVVIEQLAASLGVSRSPLREALPRLIGDGLLEEHSSGVLRVTPISVDYMREIREIRSGLEGTAAFLAATRIPADVLTDLESQFHLIELEIRRGEFRGYFEADTRFHEAVMRHCGNGHLMRMLGGLLKHVQRIRNFARTHTGAHVFASQSEHVETLSALMARDGRRAKELMEAHVLGAGERLASLLREQE